MRRLLTGYAAGFNRRHHRWGHLFQNRYKSILCQEETYLHELTRYIHLNPLRAGLVKNLEELDRYKYCGHGVLMGRRGNHWQDTGYILRLFGKSQCEARSKYRKFVRKRVTLANRADLTGGGVVRSAGGWSSLKALRDENDYVKGDERIPGDSDFVLRTLQQNDEYLERKYKIRTQGFDLKKIPQRVAAVLDMPAEKVFSAGKNRQTVRARSLLCYWAAGECGMTMTFLAGELGISTTAISQSVTRGEVVATENQFNLIESEPNT
jgi:REP-associated tyrosine transposase